MPDLWAEFCDELPPSQHGDHGETARRLLESCVQRARDAWPELVFDEQGFVRAVARALTADERGLEEGLRTLQAENLALATACARGDPRALAAFEREVGPAIERALAHGNHHRVTTEEVRQAVMVRLFVDEGRRRAKIGAYAGRGKLVNWVRIVAARTRADLVRAAGGPEADLDDGQIPGEPLSAAVDSLEMRQLEQQYRSEFQEAFTEALQALTPAQRNLLRQRIVFELRIDQVATLFEVHPATVKRRIARARQALCNETQRRLLQRLRVGQTELDSIMRVVQSRVDVSVRRILGSRSR